MSLQPVGIAGTGAVARALGRALADAGVEIVAVAGGDAARASAAARFIGSRVRPVTVADLPQHADRCLIATTDDRLGAVARALAAGGMTGGVALHTCGSRGPEALAELAAGGAHVGVFHPLQTIPDPDTASTRFTGVSFGAAGDEEALACAAEWAGALGGTILPVDARSIASYHAAAVLASNAIAALIDASTQLMSPAGVDPAVARYALAPLARTALENALAQAPHKVVTGPAVRGDASTIAAHLAAMRALPAELSALYVGVTNHLLAMAARRGLSTEKRAAVAAALQSAQVEQ